jgi:hypothetical protein
VRPSFKYDVINEKSRKIGLEIHLEKTKILSSEAISITFEGKLLERVNEYVYLDHKVKIGLEKLGRFWES